MNEIRNYINQLRPRERVMLIAAGIVVVIALLYLTIWEPLGRHADELKNSVKEQRALVAWMHQSAAEVKQLQKTQGGGAGLKNGESLLGVIDRTAKGGKLGDAMKRVEPDGSDRVRVWLERAAFDDVVVWLERIQRDYGLVIESAVIDRDQTTGRVSARLVVGSAA